jgi:hypothetical protein
VGCWRQCVKVRRFAGALSFADTLLRYGSLGFERGEVEPDPVVGKLQAPGQILHCAGFLAQERENAPATSVWTRLQSAAVIGHLPEI